jgi:pyruvate dehydrogenase E2 component (dihydrolipoamide acetyltransferase)
MVRIGVRRYDAYVEAVKAMGTIEVVDYAERWFRDGLDEATHAGGFEMIDVDVTQAAEVIARLRLRNARVTWTHAFIRATALTLARYPELHRLVVGNRKVQPASVDIGLSVGSGATVNPVLIVEDAANKDIFLIAEEVVRRVPEVLLEGERLLQRLRRWGWILPFSVMRRGFIRFLFRRMWYRRKIGGTFQISNVPQVDVCAPMIFNTAAALGIGRVRDRVIAVNGVPEVRKMVSLTCCLDHSVWNGTACARFLTALKDILESCDFAESECPLKSRGQGITSF